MATDTELSDSARRVLAAKVNKDHLTRFLFGRWPGQQVPRVPKFGHGIATAMDRVRERSLFVR